LKKTNSELNNKIKSAEKSQQFLELQNTELQKKVKSAQKDQESLKVANQNLKLEIESQRDSIINESITNFSKEKERLSMKLEKTLDFNE